MTESKTLAESLSPRVLGRLAVRVFGLALLAIALVACGKLTGSIFSKRLGAANSIRGLVKPIIDSSVSGANLKSVGALTCTSASAKLFQINASGAKVEPALKSVPVDADGSYVFQDLQALGIEIQDRDKIKGRYVVEVSACEQSYSRFITGTSSQDVSWGSTVLSFLLNTSNAGVVVRTNVDDLEGLLSQLASHNSFASAYAALSSDAALSKKFEQAFGTAPEVLKDASPSAIAISSPEVLREGEAHSLSIVTSHWSPTYDYAHLWVLDGQVIGTSNNVSYIPGGNKQGQRTLSVFWGQKNASGQLDQSKPFSARSFAVKIENTLPASAPELSIAGSTSVGMPSISLRIATGTGLRNCDTFSSLALTEDDSEPPVSESAFGITCTQGPTQTLPYVLTTGPGLKTLRLWARDSAGNVSSVPATLSINFSPVIPVVSVTSPNATISVQNSLTVAGTCEDVAGDVSLSGPIVLSPAMASCVSGLFSRVVTLAGMDGPKTITVSQTNEFGNTGSAQVIVIKDATAPNVVLSSAIASTTNQASIPVTVSFSEPVMGFVASDLAVVNATVSGFTGSGANYAFNLVPVGPGAVSVSIPAGSAQDVAGNTNLWSNALSFQFDNVPPTVSLATTATSPTNATSIPVTVLFSEAVSGFSPAGLAVTNATVSGFSGSGSSFSFNLVPMTQGPVSVQVQTGASFDAAGNGNVASSLLSRTFDSVGPTATLASLIGDPTNASPIPVTVSFTEPVTGFSLAGLVLSNAVASNLTGSGTSYAFELVPLANGPVSVNIAAGSAQDTAGNSNPQSAALSRTFTNVRPTLMLSTTSSSITKNAPIPVTAVFSAPVTGFDVSDLSPVNATVTGFAGSGATYSFQLNPSADGVVSVAVPANAATDAATNLSLASNLLSITYDTTPPTLAITSPTGGSFVNLANQASLSVSGTCSENGQNVSLGLGSVSSTVACANGAFATTLNATTLADGPLTLQASQTDVAGNTGQTSVNIVKNTAVPTATLAGAPANSSSVASLNVTVGGNGVVSYRYKVGPASSVTCSVDSGYSALSPVSSPLTTGVGAYADGGLRICVLGTNAAGNEQPLGSATVHDWVKDTSVVSFASLSVTPSSPGNQNRPVFSGFTEAAAVVELFGMPSCIGSKLTDSTASAGGAFTVQPPSSIGADGAYSFSLKATDLAGNTLCSSTIAYTLDATPPGVTLSSSAAADTNVSPIPVNISFSETVTGLSLSGIAVTNGVASGLSGSGASYSFLVTPSAQGAVTVRVLGSSAVDQAQNQNTQSNLLTLTFDTQAPVLSISSPASNAPTNQLSVTVSGLCEAGLSISVSGSGISSPSSATCGAGGTFSFAASLTSGDGSKSLSLTQTDAAGNSTTVSRAVILDTTSPSLTFASLAIRDQVTNTNSVVFSGACESGLNVAVSGTDSSSVSCVSGSWSYTTATRTSDANRSYSFTQTDAAGNSSVINGTWLRDTVAPALVWNLPAANTQAQTQITATGTCETGINLNFSGAGLLSAFSSACASGSFSQTLFFSVGEGSKSITIAQTDAAGNTATITRTFVRDNTAPVLTQTARTNPFSNSNSVTFGGACETGLAVSVSGADPSTNVACTSGTWTYTTQTKTTDGVYNYSISQTDAAGNQSQISAQFIRDVVAPVISVASTNPVINAANTASWNGSCETGASISVTGDATTSLVCSAGAWSFTTPSQTTNGSRVYTLVQTDAAGNASSSLNLNWTRDTSIPNIQLASGQQATAKSSGNSMTWSGTCESSIATITVTGADSRTINCSSGNWSYTTPTSTSDGSLSYTLTQTNSIPLNASVQLTWVRDTAAPVLTAGQMALNSGAATTSSRLVNVALQAMDARTNISHFCLRTTTGTAPATPTLSDTCWVSVSAPGVGLVPSQNLALSSFGHSLDFIDGTYTVFAWARDEVGNISVLSNSGVGTTARDRASIQLTQGSPPLVSSVIATNTDSSYPPLASSNLSTPAGSDVFIKWTASDPDESLGSSSIRIFFSLDDTTWTEITGTPIANAAGTGCAVANGFTGCFRWTSPTSSFYRIRVQATDSTQKTALTQSNAMNTNNFRILAGEVNTGLGGDAMRSVFFMPPPLPHHATPSAFVVTRDGTIYVRDYTRGILRIDRQTNTVQVFLRQTGTSTGDNGSVAQATANYVYRMLLDPQDRLVIWDSNRIRRIDLNLASPTITTILGGGSTTTTSGTIAPLSLGMSALNHGWDAPESTVMFAMSPNGNIYLTSMSIAHSARFQAADQFIRVLRNDLPTPVVETITLSGGTGHVADATQALSQCGTGLRGLGFNSGGALEMIYMSAYADTNPAWGLGGNCANQWGTFGVRIDPATGLSTPPHPPAPQGINHGENRFWSSHTSRSGKLYFFSRRWARVYRYDYDPSFATSGSMVLIAGNGNRGDCADGVAVTSCPLQVNDVFVDERERVFVMDEGRIRLIQENGTFRTIAGQNMNSGATVLATSAIYPGITGLDLDRSGVAPRKVIASDSITQRVFEITPQGNSVVIAGNGLMATPNTTSSAINQANVINDGTFVTAQPAVDSATGRIYFSFNSQIRYLDRSLDRWVVAVGGGGTSFHLANDTVGTSLMTQCTAPFNSNWGWPNVLGIENGQLLFQNICRQNVPFLAQPFLALANTSSSHRVSLLANTGASTTTNYETMCADGTPTASCIPMSGQNSNPYTRAHFDSTNSTWLVTKPSQTRIFRVGAGQDVSSVNLGVSIRSFAYRRSGADEIYYYCRISDGRVYKRVNSSAATALPWPMSTMSCAGTSMAIDEDRGVLIFPFSNGGMTGIAETADL